MGFTLVCTVVINKSIFSGKTGQSVSRLLCVLTQLSLGGGVINSCSHSVTFSRVLHQLQLVNVNWKIIKLCAPKECKNGPRFHQIPSSRSSFSKFSRGAYPWTPLDSPLCTFYKPRIFQSVLLLPSLMPVPLTSCGIFVTPLTSCGIFVTPLTSCGIFVTPLTSCGIFMTPMTSCGIFMTPLTSYGVFWTSQHLP